MTAREALIPAPAAGLTASSAIVSAPMAVP